MFCFHLTYRKKAVLTTKQNRYFLHYFLHQAFYCNQVTFWEKTCLGQEKFWNIHQKGNNPFHSAPSHCKFNIQQGNNFGSAVSSLYNQRIQKISLMNLHKSYNLFSLAFRKNCFPELPFPGRNLQMLFSNTHCIIMY